MRAHHGFLVLFAGLFVACGDEALRSVAPKIEVEPSAIDLGANPVGVLKKHAVVVKSAGTVALTVDAVELVDVEGAPPSLDLALSLDDDLPAAVGPGQTLELAVQHIPRDDVFDTAILRIRSDDPSSAVVDVPIAQAPVGTPHVTAVADLERADVEADTPAGVSTTVTSLDFGTVPIGMRRQLELYVVNAGDGNVPLEIESIEIAEASAASGLALSVDPDPREERIFLPLLGSKSRAAIRRSVTVDVAFQPTNPAPALAAVLRIVTSDPARPQLDIPITGLTDSEDPPVLRLDPAAALAFGAIATGATARATLTAYNDGRSDLVLSPLSFANNPSSVFALVAPPAEITVAAGSSQAFELTFSPQAAQAYAGALHIVSNDPARAAIDYPLSGSVAEMCTPATPDPGEPMNDSRNTAIDRGSLALPMNSTMRASWSDAILDNASDDDYSRVVLSVDAGCSLVGYSIGASAVMPQGEQAEICLFVGACSAPADTRCGMGSAQTLIFPGDDLCDQFGNQVPVYVRVRHVSGDPTCRPYTINFDAR